MKSKFIALGFLLVCVSAYGQENQTGLPAKDSKPDSSNANGIADNNNNPPASLFTVNASGNSFASYAETAKGNDDPKEKAQDWTAIGQFVCSIFIVILMGLTWWVYKTQKNIMAEQTKIASKQSEIAESQLKQLIETKNVAMITGAFTKENSERQLRAYITTELNLIADNSEMLTQESLEKGGFFVFELVVKNSGTTPAFDVRWGGGNIVQLSFPMSSEWKKIEPIDKTKPGSRSVIEAQGIRKWLAGPFGRFDITVIDKVKSFVPPLERFYIFGRIEYRDVFGGNNFTNFCYVLLPDMNSNKLIPYLAEKGNETDIQEKHESW